VLLDELYNAGTYLYCTAAGAPELLFAGTAEDDRPVFDVEQLEQLQFESAAEGEPPLPPPFHLPGSLYKPNYSQGRDKRTPLHLLGSPYKKPTVKYSMREFLSISISTVPRISRITVKYSIREPPISHIGVWILAAACVWVLHSRISVSEG
jgi:hypothetical protein